MDTSTPVASEAELLARLNEQLPHINHINVEEPGGHQRPEDIFFKMNAAWPPFSFTVQPGMHGPGYIRCTRNSSAGRDIEEPEMVFHAKTHVENGILRADFGGINTLYALDPKYREFFELINQLTSGDFITGLARHFREQEKAIQRGRKYWGITSKSKAAR